MYVVGYGGYGQPDRVVKPVKVARSARFLWDTSGDKIEDWHQTEADAQVAVKEYMKRRMLHRQIESFLLFDLHQIATATLVNIVKLLELDKAVRARRKK